MDKRKAKLIAFAISGAIAASMLLPGTALAVSAAPAKATAGPSLSSNTCTYWRALFGPWSAMDAYVARNLAWTADSTAERSSLSLESYSDKLTQCWEVLGGFGNGEIEFQMANTDFCLNVAGDSTAPGAHVILYPCLSEKNELWNVAANNGRLEFQSVSSGLCIDAGGGIAAGHGIYQEVCSNYDNQQSWYLNTSP